MRKVFIDKGQIKVHEVAAPILDENSVLVAVHYSCISPGTEIATINNANQGITNNFRENAKKVWDSLINHGYLATKAIVEGKLKGQLQSIGYSCSGQVIAVGRKVTNLFVGDFVACAGSDSAHHAELVCVSKNLVAKVSHKEFLKEASLTTLGAIALQGVRRASIQLGEIVCVVGLGILGQIAVQLAKLSGAIVIAIDPIAQRLEIAKSIGADYVFEPSKISESEIEFLTGHLGVDSTIITASSKSDEIMQQAMRITRKKGKVVLVGDVGLNLKRDPFYAKEIDFLISCSYGPGRYDSNYEYYANDYPYAYVRWTENRNMQAFVNLIEQKKIELSPLMENEFELDDAATAYDCIKNKKLSVVLRYDYAKTILNYENKNSIDAAHLTFMPKDYNNLRTAFVGVGGFAKTKLLPILQSIKNSKLSVIVDSNITAGLNTASVYKVSNVFCELNETYSKDLCDVVVIASPHKFHAEQALGALKAGKAVFLEKPMVTTWEQFEVFKQFLDCNKQAPLCVDYNRSFAPMIEKVKKVLSARINPAIITYRMNVGYIDKNHWVQTDVGAGRIIGEACHIVDLFLYLIESDVVSISVNVLKTKNEDIGANDNFVATISFQDGSIANLIYTAIGNTQQNKEYMEVFFDGKSIVLDDYKTLKSFGLKNDFNDKSYNADKGHEAIMNLFFKNLSKDAFIHPVSIKRLLYTARLTLIINDLASQGGGNQEI